MGKYISLWIRRRKRLSPEDREAAKMRIEQQKRRNLRADTQELLTFVYKEAHNEPT